MEGEVALIGDILAGSGSKVGQLILAREEIDLKGCLAIEAPLGETQA